MDYQITCCNLEIIILYRSKNVIRKKKLFFPLDKKQNTQNLPGEKTQNRYGWKNIEVVFNSFLRFRHSNKKRIKYKFKGLSELSNLIRCVSSYLEHLIE